MKSYLKILLVSCLLIAHSVWAQDQAFSFADSMERLSNYEQDITRIGPLDQAKNNSIRQNLNAIVTQSEKRLTQLNAQISQKRERLLFKAPYLLSLDNWQKAYNSISPAIGLISGDIARWFSMVSLLGVIFIFGVGPFLYRSFKSHYSNFIPTDHYPNASFYAIFILVLITNCFYFVFITQERHLELAFLIILILNTVLAILLFQRLSHVRFASQEKVVDGERIVNWTLHDQMGRQDIPVGVAYGSDTEQVKRVLLEVAVGHGLLRRYPQPQVLFKDFGDSSLNFVLRVFLKNINDRHRVGSDLRFEIDSAFRENNISIPFPQRDLHIKANGLDTPGKNNKEMQLKCVWKGLLGLD